MMMQYWQLLRCDGEKLVEKHMVKHWQRLLLDISDRSVPVPYADRVLYRLWTLECGLTLKHVDEWHEDIDGFCLWWSDSQIQNGLPFEPPLYIGSPLDARWDGKYQYFINIPLVFRLEEMNEK